jgi:hypothetical protein
MSGATTRVPAPVRRGPGVHSAGLLLALSEVRLRIHRSAVERRAATLVTRRTVQEERQPAWLPKAKTGNGRAKALKEDVLREWEAVRAAEASVG